MSCWENKHLQMSEILLGNNTFLEVIVSCLFLAFYFCCCFVDFVLVWIFFVRAFDFGFCVSCGFFCCFFVFCFVFVFIRNLNGMIVAHRSYFHAQRPFKIAAIPVFYVTNNMEDH